MIQTEFEKIQFKNLLSYGNTLTEFVYDQHKHTFVTATNGSGKSALILDSICYVLFNKPYRDIKLGQLINSINNKDLLVTIWFRKGSDRYKVVRGQKPSIFEIWKNDELIPEDSKKSDYQLILEGILGFNYKSFKQVVVIGSANYTPFMQLEAKDRRQIVEEILDIAIFSDMQKIAKSKVDELKSAISSLDYELSLAKQQLESQKRIVASAEEDAQKAETERLERLADVQSQYDAFQVELAGIEEQIEEVSVGLDTYDTLTDGLSKLEKAISAANYAIAESAKKRKFYESNDSCPTCKQEISDDLKASVVSEEEAIVDEKQGKLDSLEPMLDKMKEKISAMDAKIRRRNSLESERKVINANISSCSRQINTLSVPSKAFGGSVDEAKKQLKDTLEKIVSKTEAKSVSQDEMQYYVMATNMLKDTGIKARVISNFIPVINQFINEYLNMFDMFVMFELDETFAETIKSRHRDVFSYNSFSEGEKMKINLAILLSWRKIAMMKNSINTNLIVFDETLDQSMDADSVDVFMSILDSVGHNTRSIVVSHRNIVPELFDRHVEVVKQNDFSMIKA